MRPQKRTKSATMVIAGACISGLLTGMLTVASQSPAAAEATEPWTIPAMQYAPVPLAQSGEVVVWGSDEWGQLSVPAAVRGVAISQVVASTGAVLALTASGKVLGWGSTIGLMERPPSALARKRVTQIAISPSDGYAGAVTQDGKVVVWGFSTSEDNPINVPAEATNVTQLALSNRNAIAVKSDHTVVAWGKQDDINQVPNGLLAEAVVATGSAAYALTTTGTVVAWGADSSWQLQLPPEVTIPGNVVSISAAGQGGIAKLIDGSFVGWGITYRQNGFPVRPVLPATLAGQSLVAFDASATQGTPPLLALDTGGVLHEWRPTDNPSETNDLPAALSGAPIVQFSTRTEYNRVALVTRMLPTAAPVVVGAARVGSALRATPSAFSGTPDSVTSRWYVNGVATGNTSTTLALTPALLGKKVSYVSTAVKQGATTMTSSSAPVTVVPAPAPAKVGSVTKVTSVKAAKKGVKVKVVGKVAASKAPTGTAVVTITKGKKKVVVKTIKIPATGKVALTVAKFNKLALKAIKGKSKKRYQGKYTLTIAYSGNAAVKPSRTKKTFKVK